MDILVPDKWLREFLKSKATPKQIEKYLSLCGPSVEKVEKIDKDFVYHIEITTNRMDSAGVVVGPGRPLFLDLVDHPDLDLCLSVLQSLG